jgi:hypothetical protein
MNSYQQKGNLKFTPNQSQAEYSFPANGRPLIEHGFTPAHISQWQNI